MRKNKRTEARKQAEQLALERKSQRTGIPVQELRKPKHVSKKHKGK